MQGHQSVRGGALRVRLGLAAFFTVGLLALTMTWQTSKGQANPVPFQPQVAVSFPKDNLLRVLTVIQPTEQGKRSVLKIELIDDKDQVIDSNQLPVGGQTIELPTRVFDFPIEKAKAANAQIRITYRDQKYQVALDKALVLKAHETILSTGQDFYAGTQAPLTCTVQSVRNVTDTTPLPESDVIVRLKDKDGKVYDVAKGRTDATGQANVTMKFPSIAAGSYKLEVTTRSILGEEKLERDVKLKSDAKILLVSDKPIYQPGQLMHIRALALRPIDMKPVAEKDMIFEVEDSKGNKVYKKTLTTSEFGIASVDFQLADEVNMGDYHLRVAMGEHRADKTVTVKRYVLPKFKVEVKADKTFYLPKEKIQATLQSDYFFGKPVAKAKVEVNASTFDVAFKPFQKWTGTTDENGHVKFEIELPDYFVGLPLQKGNGLVKLEVKVLDSADHTETITKTFPVSDQTIQVSLIAESGKMVPGLENRVFAAAVYPDGSPAAGCDVKFWLGKEAKGDPLATGKTNSAGLAEFRVTPKAEQFRQAGHGQHEIEMLGGKQIGWGPNFVLDIRAEAKDAKGNTAVRNAELSSQPLGENVLLRLDKAIYQSGDSMNIDVHTSAGLPTVYVDIVRGGQIMLSRWYEVKNGQATQRIDLPQNVFGSLEIHAYQMLSHGEIIRDSRVVYVQSRDDLKIDVQADSSEYKPGAPGRLKFTVTDSKGNPAPSALGVIIVDEAVYALQEMQPGLEKVYFTLQEELMKPKVDFKFSPGQAIDGMILQRVIPAPRQQIAEVLLTGIKLPLPARWDHNPGVDRRQKVQGFLSGIGQQMFNYVWHRDDGFMIYDKAAKKWAFDPQLFEKMTKAGFVNPQFLNNSPFGGKVNLEDLARLEKSFTADTLAQAITMQRIQQVAGSVAHFANTQRERFYRNDRWELPENILAEMVKQQRYEARLLKDAWGQPLRLVKRDKKNEVATFGPVFDNYEIISAGPDGKFSTADDVSFSDLKQMQHVGWLAGVWWMNESDRVKGQAELATNLGRPGRGGMPFNGRQRLRQDALGDMQNEMAMPRLAGGAGAFGNKKMAAERDFDDAKAAQNKPAEGRSGGGGEGGAPAPITKVREYFPETMLWQPALITDDKGVAHLGVEFADSITTWRLSASANSKAGALGGVNVPLKVFQDFFVDIDLPVNLTQNDEIHFPVAVYNYLKTPQTVKIELQNEPWFELLDPAGLVRNLELKPNEVTAVKFHIRANKIGYQPITVKALGSKMSDAVKRVIDVAPNGQKIEKVISDRLAGKVTQTLDIPQDAVADASKIMVRVYPGVMSQVLEGLDGMMRMPGGCFEQTSSSAFPNVLIVDYLKKNRIASPQMMMKAEQMLNVGYQRLLTFERPGGGFDWWGSGEPLVWLSAYGLQEFSDMSKVYPIDRGIIDRTQAFLMNKMDKDGTWSNIGATHSETIASMGNPKMLLTSYVVWSLLDSGMPKDRLKNSVAFIRDNVKTVENNAYILAMAANALAAFDAKDDSTLEVLQKLDKLHKDIPEWKAVAFPATTTTMTYARGDSVTIESTALTAIAMVRTGQFTNSVNRAFTYLIKSKQSNGTWGSTSATILSLKALLSGMGGSNVKGNIPFTILVNGKEAAKGNVNEDNSDLMQAFDLKAVTQTGANQVEIRVDGETPLMYQMVARHYQPWKKDAVAVQKPVVDVDVTYDRTKLSTSDILHAKATLKYNGTVPTFNVLLELGIPPGFNVDAGDFAEMVGKKTVAKFSVTSRQVILYLGDVKPGDVLNFEYSLKPRYPLRARTPASVAYEYYTPANRAEARPVELTVEEAKK